MNYETTLKQHQVNGKPDQVFRTVTAIYAGLVTTFVCKKGSGYDDWAIYYGPEEWGVDRIRREGDKLTQESMIRNIYPCTDEVFNLYRY